MEDTQQTQPEAQGEQAPATEAAPEAQPEAAVEQKPVEAQKPQVPSDERMLSAICYVPFLALLTSPLAVIKKPESKFCEFHASQGLVLFVVWFISLWVLAIVPSLMLGGVIWLLLLIASVLGLIKAFSGSEFKIPGLAAVAVHVPVKKLFGAVKKQAGVAKEGEAVAEPAPAEEAPAEVPEAPVEEPKEEKVAPEAPAEEPAEPAEAPAEEPKEEAPTPAPEEEKPEEPAAPAATEPPAETPPQAQ